MKATRKLPPGAPKALKFGSVSFPLFSTGDGRLGFRYKSGSGWKHCVRKTLDDLRADADRIALSILNAENASLDLSAEDRRIYIAARDLLAPHALAVDAAARDIAEALRIAHGTPMRDLALFYKRHHSARLTEKTVAEAIAAVLGEVGERDLSGRFKRDVKNDLARFQTVFGARLIADINSEQILAWLRKLQEERGFGWKRRNHLRNNVVYLFSHAKRMEWLPQDRETAAARVTPLEKPRRSAAISIYIPAEMRAWIANIKPRYLPWLLICGFSTVRSEEVAPDPDTNKDPLQWPDFQWEKKRIKLRRETSKVNEPRYVPIPDNLMAWLAPWRRAAGYVCPGEQPSKRETSRLSRIARAEIDGQRVPVKWKPNALRHTAISARLAVIKNRAQVAEEAGTSEAKIREHYNESMDEEQAKAWYAIVPELSNNIVSIQAA